MHLSSEQNVHKILNIFEKIFDCHSLNISEIIHSEKRQYFNV